MKTVGTILLWAGFLSGSLATVFSPPRASVEKAQKIYKDEQARLKLEKELQEAKDEEGLAQLAPAPRYNIPDLSDVELPTDGWHQIPWVWFGCSAGACLLGVVLIQTSLRSGQSTQSKDLASVDQLISSLSTACKGIKSIQADLEQVPPSKTVASIDDLVSPSLIEFADSRETITNEFGLAVFADVMTEFAAGERAVNRAWSASADGYLDEAATCLERAYAMFQSAHKVLAERSKN